MRLIKPNVKITCESRERDKNPFCLGFLRLNLRQFMLLLMSCFFLYADFTNCMGQGQAPEAESFLGSALWAAEGRRQKKQDYFRLGSGSRGLCRFRGRVYFAFLPARVEISNN